MLLLGARLMHTGIENKTKQLSGSHTLITSSNPFEARDLEYFAVAAELGNLRRAAEALNLSQPALSKCVRRLEMAAGAKLVKRTARGIELTPLGQGLLTHARRLRVTFEEIFREVSEFSEGGSGHLRIGAAPVQTYTLLSNSCIELHKSNPKITMRLMVAANDELLPALRRGDLDVTICGIPLQPYKELVQEPLFEEKFTVYASANHKLAKKKQLTVADLAGQKWALTPAGTLARKLLQHALDSAGAGPLQIVMEAASLTPKARLVSCTDVLGFTPWADVTPYASELKLVKLLVSGLRATRLVGISYRRDAYVPPVVRKFVEIVKAQARKSASPP
jgi:DNA-binding transcriptional LysR family regulator